ncbi:hypothetical protein PRUPE_7G143200 [Prunus persica]|uniref:Uncharacterized protein n=1 Tax=Prunus persica TaxID=3760 RepID=A0A251NBD9_PRUPE|nr:hypothetical protein PRUPE_7G143200 [Prunus persica]
MDVVRDNHLKIGDVCVFVSISNSGIPLFDVVIFRSGEGSNAPMMGNKQYLRWKKLIMKTVIRVTIQVMILVMIPVMIPVTILLKYWTSFHPQEKQGL